MFCRLLLGQMRKPAAHCDESQGICPAWILLKGKLFRSVRERRIRAADKSPARLNPIVQTTKRCVASSGSRLTRKEDAYAGEMLDSAPRPPHRACGAPEDPDIKG
jgi:hypothetical protein